ncbi:hypothetical protein X975_11177, partial [Stegodyphus mimosarum]
MNCLQFFLVQHFLNSSMFLHKSNSCTKSFPFHFIVCCYKNDECSTF